MGRIEKQKRLLIEESNRRVLNEDDGYSEYGTSIIGIAKQFSGGGYKWKGGSGVCIALIHDDKIIRSCGDDTSHCCGFTLSVAFIAATNRGLLNGKDLTEVTKFSSDWYKAGGAGSGKLCVAALENLGIGEEVSLEDAQEGDFCQIWRTNGSGHSVIFLSHIYEGDDIIGFNYRSSQPSTKGIGDSSEHFSDSGKGKMKKDVTYFGRMNS